MDINVAFEEFVRGIQDEAERTNERLAYLEGEVSRLKMLVEFPAKPLEDQRLADLERLMADIAEVFRSSTFNASDS